MVKEQLIINGVEVPLQGSLDPNMTYTIEDIEHPDMRPSSYSKTITLPGSKELNDLFNFIFEINIEGSFNPNLKATAKYLVDSQMILDGFLKLNSIHYLDNSYIEYDCTLLGKTADFFTDLGDLELTDIQNLNDFQHPWQSAEQVLSWDTTVNYLGTPTAFAYGFGYTYPLIDYGQDPTLTTWSETDLYPAFYVKTLWDRIFSDAGYSYSSTFLANASNKVFRRAIVPFNGDSFGLSAAQIANRTFEADTPVFASSMTAISSSKSSNISFTDVTDTGGIHAAGIFTAPGTGRYNISAEVQLTATFNSDASISENTYSNEKLKVILAIQKNDGSGWSTIGSKTIFISPDYTNVFASGGDTYTTGSSPTAPDDEYNSYISTTGVLTNITNQSVPNKVRINLLDVPLVTTTTVRVRVTAQRQTVDPSIYDSSTGSPAFYYGVTGSNVYTNGTTDLTIIGTGLYKGIQVNNEYAAGDTIDMYGCLPRGIKQKDFVKSIMNMFNLYLEPNPTNPNELIIEPRDTFYGTTVNDWSEKLDVSQDLIFEPMGLLDASRYLFTYKEDKDYYNQKYKQEYDDIYAEKEIIVDNEFLKNTFKNEVIFSPTPSVGQSYTDRVLPTIVKVDSNNQATRTGSNVRILIYDGLKTTTTGWNHNGTIRYTYPYAGMWDDPFTPSECLDWGLPQEIYWDNTFNDISVSNNTLYNRFHKKRLEEVTDKDSKVVKGWFYLTPNDIMQLSFRNQFFFNGAYHRLLKVNNYNPGEVSLTECWFLKLKYKAQFSATTVSFTNEVGGVIDGIEPVPRATLYNTNKSQDNTFNSFTTEVYGSDNIIDQSAQRIEVYGDGNVVGADCDNVYIKGDNNNLIGGLQNVTLINTSDTTIFESDVVYINNQCVSGADSIRTVSANEDVDFTYRYYEAYTTSGNVTLDLPDATLYSGMYISFKKVTSDSYHLIIGVKTSGQTIDDATNATLTSYNDLVTIYSNGQNWKIGI